MTNVECELMTQIVCVSPLCITTCKFMHVVLKYIWYNDMFRIWPISWIRYDAKGTISPMTSRLLGKRWSFWTCFDCGGAILCGWCFFACFHSRMFSLSHVFILVLFELSVFWLLLCRGGASEPRGCDASTCRANGAEGAGASKRLRCGADFLDIAVCDGGSPHVSTESVHDVYT